MKNIVLLSDTHHTLDERFFPHFEKADEIWHAGDIGDLKVTDAIAALKPLRAVFGNIDDSKARATFELDLHFMCEGVAVFMTHIGGYPGRYNQRIRAGIYANPPKLFITGHSHILKVMPCKKTGLLHMNPGAIGRHGFHKVRTMLRFEIDGSTINNLEVIELKR